MSTNLKGVRELNWLQRAKAKLTMDDDGKLLTFNAVATKAWKKQIAIREDLLKKAKTQYEDDLEAAMEVLEELETEKTEAFDTIDIKHVGTREQRLAYFVSFNNAVDTALEKVEAQKRKIEEIHKLYKATVETHEKAKASFEEKLLMIKLD